MYREMEKTWLMNQAPAATTRQQRLSQAMMTKPNWCHAGDSFAKDIVLPAKKDLASFKRCSPELTKKPANIQVVITEILHFAGRVSARNLEVYL